jgi:uncharacterized protein (DUF362 family)
VNYDDFQKEHCEMHRRGFLGLGASATRLIVGGQTPRREAATAAATRDSTPRVGIVTSDFHGSEDHDGTKIPGLDDPKPMDAELTREQINAMVVRAIELGSPIKGGMGSIIGPEDWVVIKPNIVSCYGLSPDVHDGGAHHQYLNGAVTDLRAIESLIQYLVDHKCGARITIAEGSGEWLPKDRSKSTTDGWSTDWAGAFGGLSYKTMADRFTQKYAGIRFDLVDLNFDSVVDLPVQGNVLARNNREGIYSIPKTIQQCDRIISVAPLKTHTMTGVSLAIKNYFGIGPGASYGFPKDGLHRLGSPNEVMLDLFSFHPADYAIVGGSWGLEGDGPHAPGARSVHHNVIVAGPNAVAVDAVAASIMGFEAARLPYLTLAEKRGFGVADPDVIWIRGKDVERARKIFRKPSGWDREV